MKKVIGGLAALVVLGLSTTQSIASVDYNKLCGGRGHTWFAIQTKDNTDFVLCKSKTEKDVVTLHVSGKTNDTITVKAGTKFAGGQSYMGDHVAAWITDGKTTYEFHSGVQVGVYVETYKGDDLINTSGLKRRINVGSDFENFASDYAEH